MDDFYNDVQEELIDSNRFNTNEIKRLKKKYF